MGQRIHITKTQFLAECGLTDTGPNWDSVEERLKRLHQASAALYRGQSRIYFHFLSFGVDDNTGQCYVHLDEEGRKVFECLSYQPWRVRLNLKPDFSRRLLSYVCGHKQGAAHKISLDNLRAWFGYGGRIDKFASQMKASLAELEYMGVVRHGWSVKKTGGRYVAQWTSSKMSVLV